MRATVCIVARRREHGHGFCLGLGFRGLGFRAYLVIQKPTALWVLPSDEGVIAHNFVGFGVTGRGCEKSGIDCFLSRVCPEALESMYKSIRA